MAPILSPSQLENLVSTGKELYAKVLQSLNSRGGYNKQLPSTEGYIFDKGKDTDEAAPSSMDGVTEKFLINGGCPFLGHILVVITNPESYVFKKPLEVDYVPPYQNYIHRTGSDLNDLMAVMISNAVKNHNGCPANLERIWRVKIDNKDTTNLIEDIAWRNELGSVDTLELDSSSDDFAALLATDNGRGVARLLADYPALFGRKKIMSAKILRVKRGMPAICFILQSVPSVDKTTLSRKEARKVRKLLK